ncbi:hypothetical protein [Paraburkholderia sp. BR10882]|uniref:hypothetical protein n=1 Tax=unclassified Paraburkholderia TaxID=2615204 RepID=UPI0034CE5602
MKPTIISAAINVRFEFDQQQYDKHMPNLSKFAEDNKLDEPQEFADVQAPITRRNVKTGETITVASEAKTTYTVELTLTSIEQYNSIRNYGAEKKQTGSGERITYPQCVKDKAIELKIAKKTEEEIRTALKDICEANGIMTVPSTNSIRNWAGAGNKVAQAA